ncbi:MAG TPA: autotransporter-associated beta strand repeat-containing protein [Phycisphaerae bacterium]|nr:autotransporter-associated beta strand repeat-containing protein [Phycisphaerae bacterium]
MAKKQGWILQAAVAAVVVGSAVGAVRADTLADWTFETSQPATAGPFVAESGLNAGSSNASGLHSSGAVVYSTPAGNGSPHSFSSTTWSVGDYYQFTTSTIGYSAVQFQFDQTSSNTGPGQFQLEYSTNGTTFTNFGSFYTVNPNVAPNTWNATTATTASTHNFDLSGITALGNLSLIYLRLVDFSTVSANNGVVATAGTDRVDNVIITGTNPPPVVTLLWTGGNAAWDTVSPRWQDASLNSVNWNNANGTTVVANFNTGSNITIDGGGITSNGLTFQNGSDGVSLNGPGTLTLAGSNVTVAASNTATIGAKLSGTAGVNVLGGGSLVLSNAGNDFTGNVTVSNGTLSINSDGALGDASNTVNLAGGTLSVTAPLTESRTFAITGQTSTLNDNGNNITISSALTGAGPLTKLGTGTLTFTGSSSTSQFSGGIAITAGKVVINNADATTGISGVGTGLLSVSDGATLSIEGGQHLGRPTGSVAPNVTLTPGATGATFQASGGTTELDGETFSIGTGSGNVTIKSVGATDQLIFNTALRNGGGTTSGAVINVQGAGIVHLASGAVSTSSAGTQYSGSWVINLDQNTGILTAGPILSGGVGEVLNAFGYQAPAASGTGAYAGTTNPVTINSGTVAFGADQANPASSSVTLANSFRSPLTLNGGKIASTGLDYSGDGSADGAPVVANLAANITVNAGATSSVLLYDPVEGPSSGGRSLNIMNDPNAKETTGTAVSSNLTWGQNSTLVVVGPSVAAASSTAAASLNLVRDTGTVTVGTGATLQINSNATVVLGGAMDALSDGTHNVNVVNNGALNVTAGAKHAGGVDGAGSVDVADGTSLTADHVVQGSLSIDGAGVAAIRAGGGNNGTSKISNLTIAGSTGAWTADMSIADNKLIIEATAGTKASILSQTRDQVAFGKTHVAGITTATLASNMGEAVVDNAIVGKSTFGGIAVDSSSVLVAPELLGDANIDGHVDLTDLSTVLNNFGTMTPAWTSGNFDGAATIDLTDLSAVLNNFGLSNPNATAAIGSVATAAPEPASLAMLGVGAVVLVSRRRKA